MAVMVKFKFVTFNFVECRKNIVGELQNISVLRTVRLTSSYEALRNHGLFLNLSKLSINIANTFTIKYYL